MGTSAVEEVAAVFRRAFDHAPSGVWAAPGRVNLIGEHTDYNDGFVLPLALDRRTFVAGATRDDDTLAVHSVQRDETVEASISSLAPGSVQDWAAYVAGVVWALREAGHRVRGLDLVVDGRVPPGAGLSSSAALECAVALAVADLHDLTIERIDLAEAARRAEQEFAGVPCGIMDQAASLLCREHHVLFLDTRTLHFEHVPCDLSGHGLALLVIDTRAPHRLAEGEYADRQRTCHESAAALGVPALRDVGAEDLDGVLDRLPDETARRRVRHVVTENARVLDVVSALRQGRPRDLGPVLTASHVSLRDDYEVSSTELDAAVDAALDAGALGARMTGGGFGGSALALVAESDVAAVTRRVVQVFASRGFEPPSCFPTIANGAATRLAGTGPAA